MNRLLSRIEGTAYFLLVLISAVFVDVKLTRYKLFSIEAFLIIIFLLWIFRIVLTGEIRFKASPIVLPVFVYAGLITCYFIFSKDKAVAKVEFERMLVCCFAFFLASNLVEKEKLKILLIGWIMGSLFVGFEGLAGWLKSLGTGGPILTIFNLLDQGLLKIQGLTGLPIAKAFDIKVATAFYAPDRPWGSFGNPDFYAAYLVITIPLVYLVFILARKHLKYFAGFTGIILLLNLYLTSSRGGWLGFILSSATIFYLSLRERLRGIKLVYFVLFVTVLTTVFGLATKKTWMRPTDRLIIWRDAVKMGIDNPLGVGIGAFHIYFPRYASDELLERLPPSRFIVNYAHNEFLEVFAETGFIGLFVFLWIIYVSLKFSIRLIDSVDRENKPYSICFLAACIGILTHNMFDVNMRFIITSFYFYLILGLIGSLESEDPHIYGLGSNPFSYFPRLIILSSGIFLSMFFMRYVIEPFSAHKKLIEEPDFFDLKEQDPTKAIADLRKILRNDPKNAKVYYKMGWLYSKQKKWEQAISAFQTSVDLDPTQVGAYNNIGNICFMTGKREEAKKNYIKAMQIDPEQIDARFNLGYTFYMEGKLKEAKDQFEEILSRDPKNYKAKIMLQKMVQ